jgi:hypothetical protein
MEIEPRGFSAGAGEGDARGAGEELDWERAVSATGAPRFHRTFWSVSPRLRGPQRRRIEQSGADPRTRSTSSGSRTSSSDAFVSAREGTTRGAVERYRSF